jgi:CSLREA domain-containing protein
VGPVVDRRRSLRRGATLTALACLVFAAVGIAPVQAGVFGIGYTVNTTADAPDEALGNVTCRTSAGKCSLRAAIMQVNEIGPDGAYHRIVLPAGTFTLTIEGQDEDDAETGDLDVYHNVVIEGAGSGRTIIQASAGSAEDGIDRIFDLRAFGVALELHGLTLRRGNSHLEEGAGIRVASFGAITTLDHVVMTDNHLIDNVGGAIFSRGELTILDSKVTNMNSGDGAAVWHSGGEVTIRRSTFSGNFTYGGAVHILDDATALIDRSLFTANTSNGPVVPSALQVGRDSNDEVELTVRNSTFAGNIGPAQPTILGRKSTKLKIESSTIAGNDGFGLYGGEQTSVRNTLLSGNDDGNCQFKPTSLGNNLDTHNTCLLDAPDDIQNGISDLRVLADNGGPTRTRAIGPDSEAIDAGSNCPSFDARGASRPKDGDGDGDSICDIGAYERATFVEPTAPPSVAPTAAPPTLAPASESPQTAAPTVDPGTAAPTETGPAATLAPGETAGPAPTAAGPAPTALPAPAVGGGDDRTILWIAFLAVALVLMLALFLAFRRRAPAQT